jgi:hypothetical protein
MLINNDVVLTDPLERFLLKDFFSKNLINERTIKPIYRAQLSQSPYIHHHLAPKNRVP